MNLVFFILVLFGLLMDRLNGSVKKVRSVFSGLFQLWVSLLTIVSMIYQLEIIESPFTTNCTVNLIHIYFQRKFKDVVCTDLSVLLKLTKRVAVFIYILPSIYCDKVQFFSTIFFALYRVLHSIELETIDFQSDLICFNLQ